MAGSARLKTLLEVASTVAVVAASAGVLWGVYGRGPVGSGPGPKAPGSREIPIPKAPVTIAGAATKGSSAAKVGILEFSEFQCPYCVRFVDTTLSALVEKYVDTGQVLFAFRHFPLDIHPLAADAAELAACASSQGKFWPLHDSFFSRPKVDSRDEYANRARAAGLTREAADACVRSKQAAQAVRTDREMGGALKISGTPTFFVGTLEGSAIAVRSVIRGAQPLEAFDRAIGEALSGMK